MLTCLGAQHTFQGVCQITCREMLPATCLSLIYQLHYCPHTCQQPPTKG